MTITRLAQRLAARERLLGYWMELESPIIAERVGRLEYDYVCCDLQHGLLDYEGMLRNLQGTKAGGRAEPLVRVTRNEPGFIGKALDAGAAGVIVPLVDDAGEAATAVRAAKYPPTGARSYGPMRSALHYGPTPEQADAETAILVMIETRRGLENVDTICATPGLTGVYVGPVDLSIALGARYLGDPAAADATEQAIATVAEAAERAGVAAGIHTFSGLQARQRLDQGYTFASIAADIDHDTQAARDELEAARTGAVAPRRPGAGYGS